MDFVSLLEEVAEALTAIHRARGDDPSRMQYEAVQ